MTPPEAVFQEGNLRTTRIRDLGLTIEGTRLEPLVARLETELAAAGLTRVRPRVYLSDEWGVPFGTVAIGIPFYLARPDLVAIQEQQVGMVEGVTDADIMKYLRHEMGHVVSYAYRLYEREDWIRQFGSMTQPYLEDYRPKPFSRRYVRHLPGWYAQKHPDEDWAETFAVWLTPPPPDWRKTYANWTTALGKVEYCDRLMAELREREPVVRSEELDVPVSEITESLEEHYSHRNGQEPLPPGLEGALTAIFEDLGLPEDSRPEVVRKPAGGLIRRMERDVVANVFRWTGHFPERTRPLVRRLAEMADTLKQVYPADRESEAAVAITALVTALAMNYVLRESYLP